MNSHPIYHTGDIVEAFMKRPEDKKHLPETPHRLNPFKVTDFTLVNGKQRWIFCKACEGVMFDDTRKKNVVEPKEKDCNDFGFELSQWTLKHKGK